MNENWPNCTTGNKLKLMMFDFNWKFHAEAMDAGFCASAAEDWAFVDPVAYVDWHQEFGNNAVFLHAYTHMGFAYYPAELRPRTPSGRQRGPRRAALRRQRGEGWRARMRRREPPNKAFLPNKAIFELKHGGDSERKAILRMRLNGIGAFLA